MEYFCHVSNWNLVETEQFQRDLKKISKAYRRETAQVLLNLRTYLERLEQGNNPLELSRECTFVHREQSGCQAITQQPLPSAAQVRLYLYAYCEGSTVHLICMGDKHSQQKDNAYCKKVVEHLRKSNNV